MVAETGRAVGPSSHHRDRRARDLSPPSHDYRPGATRLALTVPDFAKGDGSDHTVVVEAREIAKVEAFLHSFAGALQHDPMAPVPELPPLDGPDESVPYDQRSAAERAAADREAVLVTTQRPTIDSESLKEQIERAIAAREAVNA
jgi:hypothetical protein